MRALAPLLALLALAACAHAPPPPAAEAHDAPPPMHHRFDDAARWSKEFDDPSRDAWQKPGEVVQTMEIAPGMTVADVGAGTGYFEPYLSRAVGDAGVVLAIDVEPDMVKWLSDRAAREKLANVRAELAAEDDPRLPAGRVDRVLIVDTWHHIGTRGAYAAKLAAALAPGGTVTIVDFTKEATHGPPPQHRLTPEQVASDLVAGGLVAEVVDEALPEQFIVIGKKPPR